MNLSSRGRGALLLLSLFITICVLGCDAQPTQVVTPPVPPPSHQGLPSITFDHVRLSTTTTVTVVGHINPGDIKRPALMAYLYHDDYSYWDQMWFPASGDRLPVDSTGEFSFYAPTCQGVWLALGDWDSLSYDMNSFKYHPDTMRVHNVRVEAEFPAMHGTLPLGEFAGLSFRKTWGSTASLEHGELTVASPESAGVNKTEAYCELPRHSRFVGFGFGTYTIQLNGFSLGRGANFDIALQNAFPLLEFKQDSTTGTFIVTDVSPAPYNQQYKESYPFQLREEGKPITIQISWSLRSIVMDAWQGWGTKPESTALLAHWARDGIYERIGAVATLTFSMSKTSPAPLTIHSLAIQQ